MSKHLETFVQFLSGIHPPSEALKTALEKEVIQLTLPRLHLLLQAPAIADHIYFLSSGFAMRYTFRDGLKVTEAFWKPGQIISSFSSFIHQEPSKDFIQLLAKSELLGLSHSSINKLLEHSDAQVIYRGIMNSQYEDNLVRIHDLMNLSASQRFHKLLQTYPDIEQFSPQEAIAAYIGITPQSLSRLKRQLGNN